MSDNKRICPKCGSDRVSVQVVNYVKLKNAHHGLLWWMFVGWWWVFVKWIFFAVPALIVKIFGAKKKKLVTRTRSLCVCQECGHHWEAKK